MFWYNVNSTGIPAPSLVRIKVVLILVLAYLAPTRTNLLSRFFAYFVCDIKSPIKRLIIYSPRKNFNSAERLISN